MDALGARAGHLYEVRDGRLHWIASSAECGTCGELLPALQQRVTAGALNDQTQLVADDGPLPPSADAELRDAAGVAHRPFALRAERAGRHELVAVAVLVGICDDASETASDVVQAVANELAGDPVSDQQTLVR